MPSSYQILLDGQPADADFYTSITSLEVEENMDLPGAFQLNLPVNRSDSGDLTYVADSRFKPLANIAVVATPAADLAGAAASALGTLGIGGGGGAPPPIIFYGYILSPKLHFEKGTTHSTLAVWGEGASWLVNPT